MGNCCTTPPESPPPKTTGGTSGEEQKDKGKPMKILLLGTGESGKSTLFNRVLLDKGVGLSEEDRVDYAESIFNLTIRSMQLLLREAEELAKVGQLIQIADKNKASKQFIEETDAELRVTPEIADHIAELWSDHGIKQTYQFRARIPELPDSCPYFFEKVHELAKVPYIPTETDVLRCRSRTTGIHAQKLKPWGDNDPRLLQIIDVGGQRAERRKWKNVFDEVRLIIFVVSIPEFDQMCFEDPDTNRLEESLEMFTKTTNAVIFKDIPILLVFNKMDLLREKLKETYHNDFDFRNYQGEKRNEESILKHLKTLYFDADLTSKPMDAKFVTAIDPRFDLDTVFETVSELLDEAKRRRRQQIQQNTPY